MPKPLSTSRKGKLQQCLAAYAIAINDYNRRFKTMMLVMRQSCVHVEQPLCAVVKEHHPKGCTFHIVELGFYLHTPHPQLCTRNGSGKLPLRNRGAGSRFEVGRPWVVGAVGPEGAPNPGVWGSSPGKKLKIKTKILISGHFSGYSELHDTTPGSRIIRLPDLHCARISSTHTPCT